MNFTLSNSLLVQRIRKVSGVVALGMGWIAGLFIVALCVLVLSDVISRNLFSSPVVGTVEVARAIIVAVTFLCLPYAMYRGAHIRTTVLASRFGRRLRMVTTQISFALGALMFSWIAWACFDPLLQSIRVGEFLGYGSVQIPTTPIWLVIILGCVVTSVECILSILHLPTEHTNSQSTEVS